MNNTIEHPQPINAGDLKKDIIVPRETLEECLQYFDWTWQQIERGEFPAPFTCLQEFQKGIIDNDRILWVQSFLREPEDPDHQDPYGLWDYQIESLRYNSHTLHKCAAEVGKTREIVAYALHMVDTNPNGSGLIGAPLQGHLDEIIEAMDDQLTWNPELGKTRWHKRYKDGWKRHPYHTWYFRNGFKLYFRPSSHDGNAYRGIHVSTFAIKDEAVKDKNKKPWSEWWRAVKRGCITKIYSVPDGDRSCEFYRLAERAEKTSINPEQEATQNAIFARAAKHIQNIKSRLFQWAKSLMPAYYWNAERKKFFIEKYGGEDTPEYKHNVLGTDGDPCYSVFPYEYLKPCIREIDEYRYLKILVDSANNEVIANGYKFNQVPGASGPVSIPVSLLDETYRHSTFFDLDDDNESEFRRLIKSFFVTVHGLKTAGADFGYSPDPTEIIMKNIIGKKERWVARLQLKQVKYDQQCQAVDAMDDIYGPETWGVDFGNAGSAVTQDLQGLKIYAHKKYEDRLRGFRFESTTDNIDEDGNTIIEAKDGKASKITMKELATDLMTKTIQRLKIEYPADPDFAILYPNHTVRYGKHRIYKGEDDHLIDAERCERLGRLFNGAFHESHISGGVMMR